MQWGRELFVDGADHGAQVCVPQEAASPVEEVLWVVLARVVRERGGEGREHGCGMRAAAGLLMRACKQLNFTLPIDSFSATAKNMLSASTPQ